MIDEVCTVSGVMLNYAKKLMDGVAAESICTQPKPNMNHPAWILGHLAYTFDSGCKLLGQPPRLPAEWGDMFRPGTRPRGDVADYPSKEALLAALESGCTRLIEAVKTVPREVLDREFPMEQFRHLMPTIGVAAVNLLTGHFGLHLGQLSAWRRASGMKGVM